MPSSTIKINPKVLVWARETAHMDVGDIPERIVAQKKLLKIESGEEYPTLVQLEKLAKKYDRPLMILLGEDVPSDDYFKLPFFRQHGKTDYDSALALFIRDIQRKQDWARNYLLDNGYGELDFVGTLKLGSDIKNSAKKIKERLNLPIYSDYSRNDEYFRSIKDTLESNHIFVSITGSNKANKGISLEEAQGFAVPDEVAPFVFVNTKNTFNAKIFTIIHELVHIFMNESGISEDSVKFRKTPRCKEDKIENYCNLVASEVLMPEDEFKKQFEKFSSGELKDTVSSLSRYFLVSELAICVRLWKLSLIEYKTYESLYSEISDKIFKYLKDQSKKNKETGGGNYYASMRSKNGALLSQLAFFAYKENKILGRELYKILNVKLDNLNNYFSTV